MVVDERARRALYDLLEEVLGVDGADTLMQHLPPTGWGDVSTRADVEGQVVMLSERMDRQVAELSARIDRQGAELTTEMTRNTDLLRAEMQALRHELMAAFRGEIAAAVTAQTRTMIFTMAGTLLVLGSLLVGVLGLR